MKKSRKIFTSLLLTSAIALSLSFSASAENSMAGVDDEEIIVDVTVTPLDQIPEPDVKTYAVMVPEYDDDLMLAGTIEPRTYSWFNYTDNPNSPKMTEGGTGGSIPILSRVYERKEELYGGAANRYCGVEAKIDIEQNSLNTNITISGQLGKNGGGIVKISASGNTNLLRAEKQYSSTSDYSNCFDYCMATVKTDSPAFGSSTEILSFYIIPYTP